MKERGDQKVNEISKNVILVNDSFQLEMKDGSSGETLRSIIHFGADTQKLDEYLFKGKKELKVKEVDFNQLALNYCSRYGDVNDDLHLILE